MAKRMRTEDYDSMASKLDEMLRINTSRLQSDWAANTTRHKYLASLFPDEPWDTKSNILKSFDKAESNMDQSDTPHKIDDVLSDVVMLRHRLASSTEAEFIHACNFRADTVRFNGKLKTLIACHATVRQAACIADDIASAVTITPNTDSHSRSTIAAIIDEVDDLQRYLCEDVGDYYICHIRPALMFQTSERNRENISP